MSSQPGRPASSPGFDWLMAGLSVLLMVGLIQDGWAHSHGLVDQSFFTPWHAILYGTMGANGLVLGFVALRNRMNGYSVRNALPYGYWLSLIGVMLFAIGGGLDLLWHQVFGIETGISGLISPTHLTLAIAAALILSGPIRSVAHQYGPETGGWRCVGPAVLSVTATLVLLGFFLGYAQPISAGLTAGTILPDRAGPPIASLYAADATGKQLTRLETPPGLDLWGVAASPDGKHLVYRAQKPQSADSGGQPPSDVYVTNIDGTHAVAITHSGRHDTQPAWSASGKWIAYISLPARTSGNFSLHVIHPDGTGDRTLVDGVTSVATPAWSSDGSEIAYASRNGVTDMLAVVNVASGTSRWLTFTSGGALPAWSGRRLYFTIADGTLESANLDGSDRRTIGRGGPSSLSADGKTLVYLARAAGGEQVFIAASDGTSERNVSNLSGMDAAHPSLGPDGRIFFSATGRPDPAHSSIAFSLAETSNMLESIIFAGLLLIVLKRWRAPFGTFTFALTLFALAMATQSDAYADVVPAFVTGLAADLAIALLGERARRGIGFWAIGALTPALFFALYLVTTIVGGANGTAWSLNLLLGSPLLAGVAGLLVAFAYEPPLQAGPSIA